MGFCTLLEEMSPLSSVWLWLNVDHIELLTKSGCRAGIACVTRQLLKKVAMLVPCLSVNDIWWPWKLYLFYVLRHIRILLFVCITLHISHISFLLVWNRMCMHGWSFYGTQLMFCLNIRWKASLYDWPVFYWQFNYDALGQIGLFFSMAISRHHFFPQCLCHAICPTVKCLKFQKLFLCFLWCQKRDLWQLKMLYSLL